MMAQYFSERCVKKMRSTVVNSRMFSFRCIYTGEPTDTEVLFAVAY